MSLFQFYFASCAEYGLTGRFFEQAKFLMRSYLVRTSLTSVLLTIGFLQSFAPAETPAATPPEEPLLAAEDLAGFSKAGPVPLLVASQRNFPAADWESLLRRFSGDLTSLPLLTSELEASFNMVDRNG